MASRKSFFSAIQSRITGLPLRKSRDGFPYVTLSYAQSIDGSIASRPGRPLALSGSESMRMTHRLRSLHDGILVGIGTVLIDDPSLTVRYANGDNPQPIIVDSRLRIPLDAKVVRSVHRPAWIATSDHPDPDRERKLMKAGIVVMRFPSRADDFIDLAGLLQELRERNIRSLMVEGGASIITSFLRKRLVDQIVLTVAPVMIGGVQAIWPLQLDYANPPRLENVDYAMFGPDLVMRADLAWNEP